MRCGASEPTGTCPRSWWLTECCTPIPCPVISHTLDAFTGELIWSVDIGYHWWQRPFAVSDGMVYVGYLPTSRTEGQDRSSSGVYACAAPRGKTDSAG